MSRHKYLTAPETAGMIRVTVDGLKKMRMQGRGPAYSKAGGKILYREADVEAWITASMVTPGERSGR
jgi:hypothetical protein